MAKATKPKPNGLSLKQSRFAREYARHGNGTKAAKVAGYRGSDVALGVMAHDNLRKPKVASAIDQELKAIERDFSPDRVRRRLDSISHAAERDGQYGPAVRAEELLGKAAGMWIDQSLQLTGVLSDSHVAALVAGAKQRQLQPVDNRDSDDD
jgi:hypothetical protein